MRYKIAQFLRLVANLIAPEKTYCLDYLKIRDEEMAKRAVRMAKKYYLETRTVKIAK